MSVRRDATRRTAWRALSRYTGTRPELLAAVRGHEAYLCRESAAWRTYLRALQRSAGMGQPAPSAPCAEPRAPLSDGLPFVEVLGALQQLDDAAARAVAAYVAELIRERNRWRTEARRLAEEATQGHRPIGTAPSARARGDRSRSGRGVGQ